MPRPTRAEITARSEATRARIRDLVDAGAATYQELADRLGLAMQTVATHIQRMPDGAEVRERMRGNKPATRRGLTALGETKSSRAWLADRRCVVSVNILRRRVSDGWDPEAALTTPAGRWMKPALSPGEAEALKAAADRVRALPRVHRHTAPDAPEMVARDGRNRLIRAALGRGVAAEDIAAATGLSVGYVAGIGGAR